MPTRSTIRQTIAGVLSFANVAAAGVAANGSEVLPEHVMLHAAAAVAFAVWGARVRWRGAGGGPDQAALGREERLELLEVEMEEQRRQLAAAHERLDFAERLMVQRTAEERQLERERRTDVERTPV
jgi:2-methylcitrate dehydratase PrpD